MLRFKIITLTIASVAALQAATVYTYNSPEFTHYEPFRDIGGYWCPPATCDHLTFTITTAGPVEPNLPLSIVPTLAWSVTDGVYTVSSTDVASPLAIQDSFEWATNQDGIPSLFTLFVEVPYVNGDETLFFNANSAEGMNHARTYNVHGGVYRPGVLYRDVAGSQAYASIGDGVWSIGGDKPTENGPEPATLGGVAFALMAIGVYRKRKVLA